MGVIMPSRQKFISTSRYQLWRRIRWGAFAIPLVIFVRNWGLIAPRFTAGIARVDDPTLGFAAALSILVLQILIGSLFYVLVWWAVCTLLMSRARREASFVPSRDIEYYREKLRGLSAVQVSMLADLRIEPREDAAATLLAHVLDGTLAFEGDRLRVADAEALRSLPRGDRTLIRLVLSGALGPATYPEWAALAEEEAVDDIHLRRIGQKDSIANVGLSRFLRGCGVGCLVLVAISVVFGLFAMTVGKGLMDLMEQLGDDYELVPYIVEQPYLLLGLVLVVVLYVVMLVGLFLPLIDVVVGLIENGDASRHLQRTALGEQEAELVYGIRNYLRDFTALSEADKGALAIWDDFLVYAVALGQNRRAVNELLGRRGLRPDQIGL